MLYLRPSASRYGSSSPKASTRLGANGSIGVAAAAGRQRREHRGRGEPRPSGAHACLIQSYCAISNDRFASTVTLRPRRRVRSRSRTPSHSAAGRRLLDPDQRRRPARRTRAAPRTTRGPPRAALSGISRATRPARPRAAAHGARIYRQASAGWPRPTQPARLGPDRQRVGQRALGIRRSVASRRVVRLQRARGARRVARRRRPAAAPSSALELRSRDSAPGRSSTGAAARAVDDGRLDADRRRRRRRAPVSAVAELVAHVRRGGRADAAEAVGAGRGHAGTPSAAQRRAAAPAPPDAPGSAGRCVSWPPAAAAAMAGARAARSPSAARARRPRPGARASGRPVGGEARGACARRPRARSAGGRPAGPWRRRCAATARVVVGARAQAVDRLGRKGHQLAGAPGARRPRRWRCGSPAVEQRHRLGHHGRQAEQRARPAAPTRARRARRRRAVTVRWPILRPRPRARPCRTGAGARRAAPARRPSRARARAPSASNHRSPSRLSITAGECRRGATSGRPAMQRTCSSNCETSQASML